MITASPPKASALSPQWEGDCGFLAKWRRGQKREGVGREESLRQTEACTVQTDIKERSLLTGHADCVPSPSQRGWEDISDNVLGT